MTETGVNDWLVQDKRYGYAVVALPVLTGALYLYRQLAEWGRLLDFGFVTLLWVQTVLIVGFLRWMYARLTKRQDLLGGHDAIAGIFHSRGMLGTGVVYGALFFWIGGWLAPCGLFGPDRMFLALFLGAHNFAVGLSLYSLAMYVALTWKRANGEEVVLWGQRSEAMSFLDGTTHLIVRAVSLFVFVAIISLFLSVFRVAANHFLLFSSVSMSFILLAYIIPRVPIYRRTLVEKHLYRARVSRLMQEEVESRLAGLEGNTGACELDRMERLERLYAMIDTAPGTRIFDLAPLRTTLSVVMLTWLPTLLDASSKFLDLANQ